jgi:hypothetical protein
MGNAIALPIISQAHSSAGKQITVSLMRLKTLANTVNASGMLISTVC